MIDIHSYIRDWNEFIDSGEWIMDISHAKEISEEDFMYEYYGGTKV